MRFSSVKNAKVTEKKWKGKYNFCHLCVTKACTANYTEYLHYTHFAFFGDEITGTWEREMNVNSERQWQKKKKKVHRVTPVLSSRAQPQEWEYWMHSRSFTFIKLPVFFSINNINHRKVRAHTGSFWVFFLLCFFQLWQNPMRSRTTTSSLFFL